MNYIFTKVNLFILCAIILSACKSDNPISTTTPTVAGSILVKVLYIEDNSIIPGAYITTYPPSETFVTDANGEITLSSLAPGVYKVSASKYSFFSNWADVTVQDGKNSVATIVLSNAKSNNKPPDEPSIIFPGDEATVGQGVELSWLASDPNGDKLLYDVYCDEKMSPTTIIGGSLSKSSLKYSGFLHQKKYYWKVVATDPLGLKSESAIYSFTSDTSSPNISTPGMVLYMPFDNSFNCTPSGFFNITNVQTAFVADRNNHESSALKLSGNSYVDITNISDTDLPGDFTIALWMNPEISYNPGGNIYYTLLGKWDAPGNNNSAYAIQINLDGKPSVSIHDGKSNYLCAATSSITKNNWVHICFLHKSGISYIYINGKQENNVTAPNAQNSLYKLRIGAQNNGQGGFTGAIDEVYIFKKALTDNEIKSLLK